MREANKGSPWEETRQISGAGRTVKNQRLASLTCINKSRLLKVCRGLARIAIIRVVKGVGA